MARTITRNTLLLFTTGLLAHHAQAQTTILQEDFTGGASTTGFTVVSDASSTCGWVYAPGGITTSNYFNQDYDDTIPSGAGFDSDFAFIDSDECTGTSTVSVNTYLVSPAFNASAQGEYHLVFDHQFKARMQSYAQVDAFNGTTWTQVARWTGNSVGYPNPAATTDLDITSAVGSSPVAQVRFQFNAGWDWWWAIDHIRVITGSTVGINEVGGVAAFRAFPDPTEGLLNVPYAGTDVVRLLVLDAMGRVVMDRSLAKTIDVSALDAGTYSLVLRDRSGVLKARSSFIKQ